MARWFLSHAAEGWSTCPISENGLIRVMSQPRYPSGRRATQEVAAQLRELKRLFAASHQFWPDTVSLTDESLFRMEHISGAPNVTDAYLLGLAAKHGGRLVSFDRTLPWQAIHHGTARLVETPLLH